MMQRLLELKERISGELNARLKVPKERLASFLNLRPDGERKMIILGAVALLMAVDFVVLINPVINVFMVKLPELSKAHSEYSGLVQDKKNEALIASNWEVMKSRADESENSFIKRNEMPALLENLSKLAGKSGIKIVSLDPGEPIHDKSMESFSLVPIKIMAAGGTHELGRFLSLLESGRTFFRVKELTITADPADIKHHTIHMDLEMYRKG